jgi:hypothetical protein
MQFSGISSICMRFLESLAGIFINVFGITQPTDATRRKAAWFILVLLLVALLVVAAVGFVLYRLLGH